MFAFSGCVMAAIAFLIAFMFGFNPAPTPGGPDHDTLFGGRGDDQLYVDKGNFVDAGARGDFVSGNKDHTLRGWDGDDLIWLNGGDQGRGGEGNDTITAGSGAFGETADLVFGDEGDDLLISNGGDTMTSGAGADTFHFEWLNEQPNAEDYTASAVTSFNPVEDVIELDWTDASGNADPVLSTGSTADGTGTVLLINGIEVAAFQGVTSLDTSTVVILRAA